MKTLLVQDYLLSGKTLEDLRSEHGVKSFVANGKIGLNYDMIEAKESDPLSQQCRGLVLKENTFETVCVPFFRFFNLEQKTLIPQNFDWNSASYLQKYDGTLCNIYNFNGKWCVGTRSRPDADVNIDDSNYTFSSLVDEAVYQKFLKINLNSNSNLKIDLQYLMSHFPEEAKDHTFCFELISPINRVVCKYDEIDFILLAVRNNKTFLEDDPKNWIKYGSCINLQSPKEYNFNSISDMIKVIHNWNPSEYEGIVVRDKNFNRIKVKNPAYISYNHMVDSLKTSYRGCVEVILLGKDDDVIGMMPQMIVDRILKLKPIIQHIFTTTEKDFNRIKHIDDMKHFASEAELCLWPAALYALKRNKTPDLKTFAMGGSKFNGINIPSSAIDTILTMCKKIDSTI